eukprot:749656-Hanusia_phi.AAC.2
MGGGGGGGGLVTIVSLSEFQADGVVDVASDAIHAHQVKARRESFTARHSQAAIEEKQMKLQEDRIEEKKERLHSVFLRALLLLSVPLTRCPARLQPPPPVQSAMEQEGRPDSMSGRRPGRHSAEEQREVEVSREGARAGRAEEERRSKNIDTPEDGRAASGPPRPKENVSKEKGEAREKKRMKEKSRSKKKQTSATANLQGEKLLAVISQFTSHGIHCSSCRQPARLLTSHADDDKLSINLMHAVPADSLPTQQHDKFLSAGIASIPTAPTSVPPPPLYPPSSLYPPVPPPLYPPAPPSRGYWGPSAYPAPWTRRETVPPPSSYGFFDSSAPPKVDKGSWGWENLEKRERRGRTNELQGEELEESVRAQEGQEEVGRRGGGGGEGRRGGGGGRRH